MEAGPTAPATGDDDQDGGDYGPAAAAGGSDDDDQGDDEEGRFFGGGISAAEAEVLDYVDAVADAGPAAPAKIDAAWVRKTALAFEKRISRNAQLRARHEADPPRFMESEADLDAEIKGLALLAEHPECYAEFAGLGCAASLVGLLAHDNTDIAIAAVEVVGELTEDEVGVGGGDVDDFDEEADEDEDEDDDDDRDKSRDKNGWDVLVAAMLDADLLGLLVSNLERLDEEDEADRNGVYHALSVVENLCSRKAVAEQIAKQTSLLVWLIQRAQKKESPVSQNKQYAVELLAILVQSSNKNRKKLAGMDVADTLLQLAAVYRKRDPQDNEETEYMTNIFGSLTSIVDGPEGKAKFVEAEGVELCLIILKEGEKLTKAAALRLLDHAVSGVSGAETCQKLVDAGGLKPLFTMFMKKQSNRVTMDTLMTIFMALLQLLPADSPERTRTLAKFVEKEYEKTEKLLALRDEYARRLAPVETQIARQARGMNDEEREMQAGGWYLARIESGLYSLMNVDLILAWLVAEDDGARNKITSGLAERGESLGVVRKSLQERLDNMDPKKRAKKDTRDMLSTLIDFLR